MSTVTNSLYEAISRWAKELGFQDVGFTGIDLGVHRARLSRWVEAGYQGEMEWMQRQQDKRGRPELLIPGTVTLLSLRMDYLPEGAEPLTILKDSHKGYVSRYALGRDYHKLMRRRLSRLAKKIEKVLGGGRYRAFVDSAPVLERAVAEQSGLGWIAKNTMLINEQAGSYFFLGEIYTDIPFEPSQPRTQGHCGTCTACLTACPTNAFVAPFILDARRCISYLTIEHPGNIDEDLRPLMGNRIYGCDDCQLVCPWNKFAKTTQESDFSPRHRLDEPDLCTLFQWSETEFLEYLVGSPIRRIGYERWQRNIAIALGNAAPSRRVVAALKNASDHPSAVVREHVTWALKQQYEKANSKITS